MLPFKSIDQFWFLYALIVCQLIAVVASRTTALLVGAITCALLLRDWVPGMIALAFSYFPFTALGILLSRLALNWRPDWVTTALVSIGFAAAVGISYFTYRCWFPCLGIIPAGAFGIAMAVSFSKLLPCASECLLARLGRSSLTIFCLHVIFGSGFRIFLSSLFPDLPAIFHILLGTAVGLILPMLLHEWLERRQLLGYVGFSRFR